MYEGFSNEFNLNYVKHLPKILTNIKEITS